MNDFSWLLPNIKQPTWTDVLIAVVFIVCSYALQQYVLKPMIRKVGQKMQERKHKFIGIIIISFNRSIRFAFLVTAIFLIVSNLFEVSLFTGRGTKNLYISCLFYFGFKGVYDLLTYFLVHPDALATGKDQDLLTPFFLRISKVVVMVIAMFSIASLWEFNLNGFLTGIGLTGVAIAFGIRETLAHFFGGLSVALDKPFQIGDWIATEDQKIEGIVEDINLRSTLIQTGDKGLVYVPNAYLVNRPIYNYTKREKRKCEHYFYIPYDSNEKLVRGACEKIREQIMLHSLTEKDIVHVAVDDYRPGSFRIVVRYYVGTNDTAVMLKAKQDILFACKQVFEEQRVSLIQVTEEQLVFQENLK